MNVTPQLKVTGNRTSMTRPQTDSPTVKETLGAAIEDRVCLNLKYKDSERIVLPSKLRHSKAGDLLLQARRWEGDKLIHRTYRVDRIQQARKSALTAAAMLAGPCGVALASQT